MKHAIAVRRVAAKARRADAEPQTLATKKFSWASRFRPIKDRPNRIFGRIAPPDSGATSLVER
jgi:hypothetical protein